MRGLLPIGNFSRLSRLSVRTLRRYDEQGLLVPAVVDPANHRRWYSATQTADAQVIRLLRDVDVPLEQVREIVGDRDPGRVRARLVQHRARMKEQVAHLRAALDGLDALIDDLSPLTERTIIVEDRPGLLVASRRLQCSLRELPDASAAAFGSLHRHLTRHAAAVAGPPLAIYRGEGFDPDCVDVELALPISRWLPVDRPGGVDVRTLPAVRAVTTLHVGSYERIDAAYRALGLWAGEHDLALADEPREIYLIGPDRSGPQGLRTEIVWPLE